jgi:hypothetical protein
MADDLVRKQVIRILNRMLDGELNVIHGCLELDFLWHKGHEFIGADYGEHYSHLAHIPLPEQYHLWNKENLMKKLKELDGYKPNVLYTVRLLLKELNQ